MTGLIKTMKNTYRLMNHRNMLLCLDIFKIVYFEAEGNYI